MDDVIYVDIDANPVVYTPDGKPRAGRGFSLGELKKAGMTIKAARDLGLMVDLRRSSAYDENVKRLQEIAKAIEELASEMAKEEPAADSE